MADRLDIVILGASGFTGLHSIPYIHKLAKSDGRNLTWGVAGRSEEKLKESLEWAGKKVGTDISKIPIIICDIKSHESLLKMAQQAKVVINCCGPYRFLGEAVVKACIEAGTHHVDVSGEPQFMETIQLEYDEAAKEKGVYVISACGLDSIPADLGTVFLQKQFDGVVNSVTTYLEIWNEDSGSPVGPLINYGTWDTIVHGLNQSELIDLRRKLFPKKMPAFEPKLKSRQLPHKSNLVDGWIIPFLGADRSVIKRSQRYFYEHESKRPVQIDTLVAFKSFYYILVLAVLSGIWLLMSWFKFGMNLLLKYPEFFSFGICGKQPPSEEVIEQCWFQITFYGEGWKEKLSNKDDQYSTPPDKSIVARVKGKNPGYGATCACLVGAAIITLTEKEKLAGNGKGGVYPPGAAFANTSLIDLLNDNGLNFDVIAEKDI